MRVGVVIVSYNSELVLPGCLTELCNDPAIEVVVVDNGSRDGSVEVSHQFGVETVRLPRNAGFAFACNAGVAGLKSAPEWLAFVNPDVVIAGRELLRAASDAPDEFWVLSPLLVDPAGGLLPDIVRPEPTLSASLARYLLTGRGDVKTRQHLRRSRSSDDRYAETEVTSGACMLIRYHAFTAAGGFNEAYFLNMEDVEICCRVRSHGGRVAVDRFVSGVHVKGSASSTVTAEQRMFECARAEVAFFQQNRPAWQTVIVAGGAFLGCVGRSLVRRVARGGPRQPSPRHPRYASLAREISHSVAGALTGKPPARPALPVFVDA